jgi:hypothetical protein
MPGDAIGGTTVKLRTLRPNDRLAWAEQWRPQPFAGVDRAEPACATFDDWRWLAVRHEHWIWAQDLPSLCAALVPGFERAWSTREPDAVESVLEALAQEIVTRQNAHADGARRYVVEGSREAREPSPFCVETHVLCVSDVGSFLRSWAATGELTLRDLRLRQGQAA